MSAAPWRVDADGNVGAGPHLIAQIHRGSLGADAPDPDASARLIAAAPELLAACEAALGVLLLLGPEIERMGARADKAADGLRAAAQKAGAR